jgi:hypothetical protein
MINDEGERTDELRRRVEGLARRCVGKLAPGVGCAGGRRGRSAGTPAVVQVRGSACGRVNAAASCVAQGQWRSTDHRPRPPPDRSVGPTTPSQLRPHPQAPSAWRRCATRGSAASQVRHGRGHWSEHCLGPGEEVFSEPDEQRPDLVVVKRPSAGRATEGTPQFVEQQRSPGLMRVPHA